jgi:hypothetical protein
MAKTIDIKAEDDAATMWGDAPYIFCPPKDFFYKKSLMRSRIVEDYTDKREFI